MQVAPTTRTENEIVTLNTANHSLMSLERLLQSPAFLEDAQRFAAIPGEAFEQALNVIQNAPGFTDTRRVRDLALSVIGEREQATSLVNFIVNFGRIRREWELSAEDLAEIIVGELPSDLDETVKGGIESRLVRILAPIQGVERQAKADRLRHKTGAHLDDFAFVSDLRPVFDTHGENIEGLIPLTTLKLVVRRGGEFTPTTIEVHLSENQLNKFSDDIERAKRKLHALNKFVKTQNDIELPESMVSSEQTP